MREKDFHLATKKINQKQNLKTKASRKKSTKRCDGLRDAMDPKQTESHRIESNTNPNPNPNQTRPGLAWQQVADAVADDHEDHRRDRSVAPKTGDTSCVNKPLTR